MGQANLRGTKEQRVAEGIIKARKRHDEAQAQRDAYWLRMSPKHRREVIELGALTSQMSLPFRFGR